MPFESILFLAFVIAVFGGFGLMLAYASWITTGRHASSAQKAETVAPAVKSSRDA